MKIAKKILIVIGALTVLLFINNNYFKNIEPVIKADGAGYYDYLPSIFILKDFNRKSIAIHKDSIQYNRVLTSNFHVSYLNHKVNKYPIGTALLQSPFFFVSFFIISLQKDTFTGFEMIFQKGVLYAAFFYLLLGLYFLYNLLKLYKTNLFVNLFVLMVTVYGTNIIHYSTFDASYSHVFSFALISSFLFFTKLFTIKNNTRILYICFALLGLIILTRQINILIVLFIPFLFNSFEDFKHCIFVIFKNQKQAIALGFFILLIILSFQCIAWYIQTGSFILYSYQNEHFNFFRPEIINLLVSYKKGLFIYTPLLFISLVSLMIYYFLKKDSYHLITWILPFLIISYVFSSWWCWYYGASLGMRVFVDYYAVFMLPLGIVLNNCKLFFKYLIISSSLMTMPYSSILTYQYKHFIIDWINMDKNKFWFTFLKQNNTYKGLVWLDKLMPNTIKKRIIKLKSANILADQKKILVRDTIHNSSSLKYIKIKLKNKQSFDELNESIFVATVSKPNQIEGQFFHQFYLYHFIDYLNPQNKNGTYVLNVENVLKPDQCIFQLEFASDQNNNKLEDISIEYY